MARDYELKLVQMRVYAKTPAGKISKAKSRATTKLKRGVSTRTKKNNYKPLLKALANWTQP